MESKDHLSNRVILDLVNSMELLSQNQLKVLIQILQKNKLSADIIDQVNRELGNLELIYGYLLKEFMNGISEDKANEN